MHCVGNMDSSEWWRSCYKFPFLGSPKYACRKIPLLMNQCNFLPDEYQYCDNCMDQRPFRKTYRPSAGQEILFLLWNQKFNNCVHKSLPLVLIERR